ncbi:MAG: ThiF family adenylyltransferase, partial [Candidatus Anammoxibacter sp.]
MKSDNYDMERYSRQILFENIGIEGQKKLRDKYAVIAGCGALGSVIASSLVRGGIGRLKIIDRDFVDESNLQRQMLFDEDDVSNDLPKAIAAKNKLQKINSSIVIEAVVSDINYSNVEELTKGADIVLDGLDNFETRFLLNDCCVKHKIPWIYGACVGSSGLTMNVIPDITPCLRCIFETLPPSGTSPTCDTDGIIAPIANIIASIQVTEAFKILTDNLDAINRTLIRIDVWDCKYDKINVETAKDVSDCPVCKNANFEFLTG